PTSWLLSGTWWHPGGGTGILPLSECSKGILPMKSRLDMGWKPVPPPLSRREPQVFLPDRRLVVTWRDLRSPADASDARRTSRNPHDRSSSHRAGSSGLSRAGRPGPVPAPVRSPAGDLGDGRPRGCRGPPDHPPESPRPGCVEVLLSGDGAAALIR